MFFEIKNQNLTTNFILWFCYIFCDQLNRFSFVKLLVMSFLNIFPSIIFDKLKLLHDFVCFIVTSFIQEDFIRRV